EVAGWLAAGWSCVVEPLCCATAGSASTTARSSATNTRFFIFYVLRGGAWGSTPVRLVGVKVNFECVALWLLSKRFRLCRPALTRRRAFNSDTAALQKLSACFPLYQVRCQTKYNLS